MSNIANYMLMDFIYFSLIEAVIFVLYVYFDNYIKTNKIYLISSILLVAILNTILYTFLPTFVHQFALILYMSLFFTLVFKIKLNKSFVSVFKILIIMLVTETLIAMIINFSYNVDITNFSSLNKFIISLLFRIFEFSIIYIKYIKNFQLKRW